MEDRIVLMIGRARLAMGFLALASACSGATTATGTGGNPSLGAGTAGAGNTGGSTGAGGLAGGGGSGGSGTTTSGGGAGGGPVAGASGTNGGNGGASGAGGTSVGRGGAGGLNTGTGGSGGAVGGSGAGGATAAGGASGSFPGQTCLSRADGLVAQMTANEKYGQMLQMERQGLTAQDVTQYFLGSAFSQGGSAPSTNSAAGWADMTDAYRQGALATRLKIPFLYGADEVHGVSTVQGATIFPHNIGLGASRDAALVEQIGRTASDEGRGCGVDFFFSPVVAVALDERWGRTYEAYGETSDLASTMGVAMTKGIQFSATGAFTGILANAKHYLGDGGTAGGVTGGNTAGDETKLRAIHLAPYQAVVDARVGSIMPSYSSWQGTKMHIDKTMITDVLKGQLGFGGFIVSDFNACFQLGLSNQAGIEQCTNAGVDMFMAQGLNVSDMVGYLATAVKNGNVPQSRIDDAVRRIVAVKCELGLFEATGKVDRSLTTNVGSADHRALARKAVQESLVVLKNDGNVLPLAKTATVALAGKSADNTGNQCGGWTITWQGGYRQHRAGRDKRAPSLRLRSRRKPSRVFGEWLDDDRRQRRRGGHRRNAVLGRLRRHPQSTGRHFMHQPTDHAGGRQRRRGGGAEDEDRRPQDRGRAGDRAAVDARSDSPYRRRDRSGVAARQRSRGHHRHPLRRRPSHRQAAADLASLHVADPDQLRRRDLRPALRLWLRADLLELLS
jgi:beta-glucosidase